VAQNISSEHKFRRYFAYQSYDLIIAIWFFCLTVVAIAMSFAPEKFG